jgi:hypothetical protein
MISRSAYALVIQMEEVCTQDTNPEYFTLQTHCSKRKKKLSKAIPVTGRGGLQGCEMSRIPHCLDNQLTDGSKVVSPTHRPRFIPQKHYFSASSTHFC